MPRYSEKIKKQAQRGGSLKERKKKNLKSK